MARQPSRITKISGKLYRVTPFDPAAEARRRKYDKANMRTVSTRVPKDVYEALKAKCLAENTTIYTWLQNVVAQRLAVDVRVGRNRAEWARMRQQYGALVTNQKRRQGCRQYTNQNAEE